MSTESLRECIARGMAKGLIYMDARHGCLPAAPPRVKATSLEVLLDWWWLLLLGFVVAVAVPLLADWDKRNRRGKYSAWNRTN